MRTMRTSSADDGSATAEQSVLADDLELCRIRGEYREMPGLCLTGCQAQRLWGLPCERCEALLGVLIDERFLVRTTDGRFIRCGGDLHLFTLGGPE
ncbi:MAG TPA: hypothetical protein VI485_03170 [Vicinamibacterales bacterium]|nr:hypothetical protein [Vicinamibacterales bacterium]